MNNIKDIIQAMQNADWSGTHIGNKCIVKSAILALMDAQNAENYRARATKAEQENALLRAELAKKPKGYGLHKTLVEMLKLGETAQPNQIIQKVKMLRDNQELYKQGAGPRQLTKEEKASLIQVGYNEGLTAAVQALAVLRDGK